MFRNRSPPIPQPVAPASTDTGANYMSAQIQSLLSTVLPEPIVTILATISDLLYRAILGKPNEPPTYTSTFVPPLLLVLVTYLSLLFIYRSIKSFFSFLLFSVKWLAILGVIVLAIAYSFGNGNLEQGARVAAQKSGLNVQDNSWSEVLQRYPAAQQIGPQLYKSLGGMTAALPFMQEASNAVLGVMQRGGAGGEESVQTNYDSQSKSRITREYRDVRPAKKRFSFGQDQEGSRHVTSNSRKASRSVSNPAFEQNRRKSSSTFQGIAKFIGADLGN